MMCLRCGRDADRMVMPDRVCMQCLHVGMDMQSQAREHTEKAMQTLVRSLDSHHSPTRVRAAEALLDRGWGRATHQVSASPPAAQDIHQEILSALQEHPEGISRARLASIVMPQNRKGDSARLGEALSQMLAANEVCVVMTKTNGRAAALWRLM